MVSGSLFLNFHLVTFLNLTTFSPLLFVSRNLFHSFSISFFSSLFLIVSCCGAPGSQKDRRNDYRHFRKDLPLPDHPHDIADEEDSSSSSICGGGSDTMNGKTREGGEPNNNRSLKGGTGGGNFLGGRGGEDPSPREQVRYRARKLEMESQDLMYAFGQGLTYIRNELGIWVGRVRIVHVLIAEVEQVDRRPVR